jgi:hypothetical protein
MAVTDRWTFGVAPETAKEVAKGSHQNKNEHCTAEGLFVTHMRSEKSSMGRSQVQMSGAVKFQDRR